MSIEPFKEADPPMGNEQAVKLLEAADIFSPNLSEAVSILGPGSPPELLSRMGELGARVIALRMGVDGSLVSGDAGKHFVHIPAFSVKVVDPVGAGNAFCGGFLAGWRLTGDIVKAGRYASVSASFLLEQAGLPGYTPELQEEAFRRLKLLTVSN